MPRLGATVLRALSPGFVHPGRRAPPEAHQAPSIAAAEAEAEVTAMSKRAGWAGLEGGSAA